MGKLDKVLYNKTIRTATTQNQVFSVSPFGIEMGWNEVIDIRKILINYASNQTPPSVDTNTLFSALSVADNITADDQALVAPAASFLNLNEVVFGHTYTTHIADQTGELRSSETIIVDFEPGMILLPRSPSGILYAFDVSTADGWILIMSLYYQKRKVNKMELLQLMKMHKSIKGARVPSVIDE